MFVHSLDFSASSLSSLDIGHAKRQVFTVGSAYPLFSPCYARTATGVVLDLFGTGIRR